MIARLCVVFGISHNLQRGFPFCSEEALSRFQRRLDILYGRYGFKCVIEEFNTDALNEAKIAETSVQLFAKRIGVEHSFCDPTAKERDELGIQSENSAKINFEFSMNPTTTLEKIIFDANDKREKYWLEVVERQAKFPLLFVCGENHINSFEKKLIGIGACVCETSIFD